MALPQPPASVVRLRKRRDFLRVRKGVRAAREAFVLEAAPAPSDRGAAGVGFTVTRRVGKAVARNRMRRRLKAAIATAQPFMRGGCDYVVVARRPALWLDFARLSADLAEAIATVHQRLDRPRTPKGPVRAQERATSDTTDQGNDG